MEEVSGEPEASPDAQNAAAASHPEDEEAATSVPQPTSAEETQGDDAAETKDVADTSSDIKPKHVHFAEDETAKEVSTDNEPEAKAEEMPDKVLDAEASSPSETSPENDKAPGEENATSADDEQPASSTSGDSAESAPTSLSGSSEPPAEAPGSAAAKEDSAEQVETRKAAEEELAESNFGSKEDTSAAHDSEVLDEADAGNEEPKPDDQENESPATATSAPVSDPEAEARESVATAEAPAESETAKEPGKETF